MESLYWYDRKVFEIIDSGESFQSLSDKTNISYYSLYNTYRKVKKHLKRLIQMNRISELIKNQIHPITGWEYRKERDKAIMLKQQRRREKRKK